MVRGGVEVLGEVKGNCPREFREVGGKGSLVEAYGDVEIGEVPPVEPRMGKVGPGSVGVLGVA